MEILYLTNRPTNNSQAATVTEYLDALHKHSCHRIHEISMLHHFPTKVDLNRFDVVITHYSLSIGPMLNHYLGTNLVDRIKQFKGLKVAFLQDEYREIKTYWQHINELGIDVLFSCVPDGEISKVYPQEQVPNLRVVNVLTGYVPESLLSYRVTSVAERRIDVGYRTRKTPYWLGRLGYEKWFISEEFQRRSDGSDLVVDLSTKEGERLYGEAWIKFVASCRAVIGVESGASIIDFDGKLEHQVEDYVGKHPKASFEEVSELFLRPYEGSLSLHQISPRCFEAAALKTPMILFEGYYSGVLKPERHFIVLKKDFSNYEEVLSKLRDHNKLQEMADRTYSEIAMNSAFSYKSFINKIDEVLAHEVAARCTVKTSQPYTTQEFRRAINNSLEYVIRRRFALFMQSILLGAPMGRKFIFGLWYLLPRPLQQLARPLARIISR